jgi:hypothetical protein
MAGGECDTANFASTSNNLGLPPLRSFFILTPRIPGTVMGAVVSTIIGSVVGGLVYVFALVCCSHRRREQNKFLFDDEPVAKGAPDNDSKLA